MEQWTCEKIENCFADTQTYAYYLPFPVTEEMLLREQGDGELKIKKNFRRPCYFLDLKNGIRIKGLLEDDIMKVSFPNDSWEMRKQEFETGKCGAFLLSAEAIQNQGEQIGTTESVCPVCLERIPARKIRRANQVFLEKNCPAHGVFSACIWNGQIPYEKWDRAKHNSRVNARVFPNEGCPYDCGICTEHKQKTCCVLLEVTQRCNLCCPICFASSKKEGCDLSLEEIQRRFTFLMEQGGPFNVQISGGEPTMRDDLNEIIRMGKETGIEFFQLNTNGIRLAKEPEYVMGLAKAGLNCVFLQFDGMEDQTYRRLRGCDLLELKKEAIRNCARANLGVVLVPVIVHGVNEKSIGPILDFAIENMPVVRGVHFQPMSYFGRHEATEEAPKHFTLSDLLQEIELQTEGRMKMADFTPGNAENPYCSMSGNFYKQKDGKLCGWKQEKMEETSSCCCQTGALPELSDRARAFVARQWSGQSLCCDSIENHIFAVSAMVFMDAWNLDLERLRQCYIHEVSRQEDGLNLIPFCAYNLTSIVGESIYREKEIYE